MRKSQRILIIVLTLTIGILAVVSYFWTRDSVHALENRQRSALSPVIMIPGSSATVNRFDTLVEEINKHTSQKHSLLKVKVFDSGKISYYGKIKRRDTEPFIVVGFENNKDGYNNIKKQAQMFNKAFNQLKETYNFNNFKGIGHSNGGLIYTYYLEHYFNEKQIQIKRLMTIGTPYNFAEPTSRRTDMLKDFIKYRKNLPNNLIMYSIAGSENYIEDGLVPVSSVLAGKYVYQGAVKQYTQITVTGKLAQHSALPQNSEVLDLIQKYVLNQPQINSRQNQQRDR
ncbi:putative alpha/beta hydrolase family protein [Lactobacillus colini]|uniref:Alpha/beta hydrolase family protein n=1 Tax=Lactobacillus colini TaxID=1819254 RepID=A0ABS4MGF9_9LACO|nr:alpha/beta hydrolase [Lactobacillus colini]MBP2058778.1 putative alpha/beta hydrolase family protein [Lactobacillus colini]